MGMHASKCQRKAVYKVSKKNVHYQENSQEVFFLFRWSIRACSSFPFHYLGLLINQTQSADWIFFLKTNIGSPNHHL